MVDLGSHRLHIHAVGEARTAAPTVVFDAALGGSSLGWCFVQAEVARFLPTVSYDRAGLGWSETGPQPRTLPQAVAELHSLLRHAGVEPPYVLVGHSYGGLVSRLYAATHPDEVTGLVLVDAPAPETWMAPNAADRERLAAGVRLARRGVWAARTGVAKAVATLVGWGALTPAAKMAKWVSGGRLRGPSDYNFAPAALLPPPLKAAMRAFWSRPAFYQTLASQMEHLPAGARLVAETPLPAGLALIVLSAHDASPERLAEQDALARTSALGQHRVAARGGHWIPLESPGDVVSAIRDAIARKIEQ